MAGIPYFPPPMFGRCYFCLPLISALVCCASARTRGDEIQFASAAESTTGVLVLVNGNMLQGQVYREGDVYRVKRPTSEVAIRVEQVDFFCLTVDEAYERRRLQRIGSSADSHIELARWCLRHGMLEYASRELLEARQVDAGHRQLPILVRQLQLALQNREAKSQAANIAEDVAPPNDAPPQVVEDVPDWARTLFVRQIQPLLVNSCAASGCHHPGGQESFLINRLAIDGPGHPATTLANLAEAVKQVDRESPGNSPLLLKAKTEHGSRAGLKPHALEPRQYHMLATWVEQLAIGMGSERPQPVELAVHNSGEPETVVPAGANHLASGDPFDPTQFNRQSEESDEEVSSQPESHPESE